MGKRDADADLETDAELWARVARSARPLRKGTVVRPVAPPKARSKQAAKEFLARTEAGAQARR